jgi:hypothetical protein
MGFFNKSSFEIKKVKNNKSIFEIEKVKINKSVINSL